MNECFYYFKSRLMTDEIKSELERIINKYVTKITKEEKDYLIRELENAMNSTPEEEHMNLVHEFEKKIKLKIKEDKEKSIHKKKRFINLLIEIYAWLFLGVLCSFIFWGIETKDHELRFVFVSLFVLFPFIFQLIFSELPFAYFRDRYVLKKEDCDLISKTLLNETFIETQSLLLHCIQESKSHAERLFSHSRACLFWGCFIAVLGLGIFFFLNDSISINGLNNSHLENNLLNLLIIKILEYLPRFGVLFFIEYIAFFFLKQYRILMEEYRYYESIKREKQDILATYLSIKELEDKKEALDQLLNYMDKHSAVVPQITGTHKLKTEKMVYDDLDFISKVTSLIQAVKPNEKAKGD